MKLDPAFVYLNYAEACVWVGMGVFVVYQSIRSPRRKLGFILAVTLFAFGGSDVVEAHTGAWYDPWWLFVWKALCVLVFLICGIAHAKRRRRESRESQPAR